MRMLLESTLLRQLSLLETLYESGSFKIEELAEKMQLSGKTVSKDLIEAGYFISPIEIVNNSRGLYSLYIPENCSIDFLYSAFLKQSARISILEEIFFHDQLSFRDLSEKLFLSESTLKRTVSSMNEILSKFDIRIMTRPFRLEGYAPAIDNLFIILFTEKYQIPSHAFPEGHRDVAGKMIQYWMSQNQVDLNFPDLNKLTLWILVSLYRQRIQPPGSANPSVVLGAEHYELFDREIQSEFHINFKKAPEQDSLWETVRQIFKFGYILHYDLLEKACDDFPPNREVLDCVVNIINYVSGELDVPVQNYEKLVTDLFNLVNLARNLKLSQFILNDKKKRFFKEASEQEKSLYFVLEESLHKNVLKEYEWKKSDVYELFYILTTHWSNLLPALQSRVRKLRVGLFFDTDQEHAQYITRRLSYRFLNEIEIFIMNALSQEDFLTSAKDFDLVITNISQHADSISNVLCISPMPTNGDWFRISEHISSI